MLPDAHLVQQGRTGAGIQSIVETGKGIIHIAFRTFHRFSYMGRSQYIIGSRHRPSNGIINMIWISIITFLFLSIAILINLPHRKPGSYIPVRRAISPDNRITDQLTSIIIRIHSELVFHTRIPPANAIPVLTIIKVIVRFHTGLFCNNQIGTPHFTSRHQRSIIVQRYFSICMLLIMHRLLRIYIIIRSPDQFALLIMGHLIMHHTIYYTWKIEIRIVFIVFTRYRFSIIIFLHNTHIRI